MATIAVILKNLLLHPILNWSFAVLISTTCYRS